MWRRTLRYRSSSGDFRSFVWQDVRKAIRLASKRMRSSTTIGDGAGRYLRKPPPTGNFPPGLSTGSTPEDLLAAQDRPRLLAGAIRGLPPRERAVLDGRLAGRTVTELAARLRISHQRVCQLWGQGVRKVRERISG